MALFHGAPVAADLNVQQIILFTGSGPGLLIVAVSKQGEDGDTPQALRARRKQAYAAHARFASAAGDALSALRVLCAYEAAGCSEHFCMCVIEYTHFEKRFPHRDRSAVSSAGHFVKQSDCKRVTNVLTKVKTMRVNLDKSVGLLLGLK